ncbi:MAG: amidase family protein, partial [Candidatus Hodarchaeales archaeon]
PPVSWPDPDKISVNKLKVAVYTDNGVFSVSPAIRRAVEESSAVLREQGASITQFTFPEEEISWKLYLEVNSAGGTESLPRQLAGSDPNDLLKDFIKGFTLPRLIRRFFVSFMNLRGQKHLASTVRLLKTRSSEEYWQLVERVKMYRERFLRYLEKENIDIILCPVSATVAPLHGTTKYLLPPPMSYSILYNLLGMPAGVVSVTRVKEGEEVDMSRKMSKDRAVRTAWEVEKQSVGLPVGVQVAGWHWREDVVLKVMEVLEEHFKTKDTYPINQKLL